jgi:hypothetical protein
MSDMDYIELMINDPYAKTHIGVVSSRGGKGDSYFIEISKGSGRAPLKFAIHESDIERFKGVISKARDLQAKKKQDIKDERKRKLALLEKMEIEKLG